LAAQNAQNRAKVIVKIVGQLLPLGLLRSNDGLLDLGIKIPFLGNVLYGFFGKKYENGYNANQHQKYDYSCG
jgi:hypothetical protein